LRNRHGLITRRFKGLVQTIRTIGESDNIHAAIVRAVAKICRL
jgi:hypothetical protein